MIEDRSKDKVEKKLNLKVEIQVMKWSFRDSESEFWFPTKVENLRFLYRIRLGFKYRHNCVCVIAHATIFVLLG